MKENDGAKATTEASSPPQPAGRVADDGHRLDDRPRCDLPSATALRNCLGHPVVVRTASPCISGTITNPPPKESAPTLSAAQASDQCPAVGDRAEQRPERARPAARSRRLASQLDRTAGEQHEHEPWPDRRRRDAPARPYDDTRPLSARAPSSAARPARPHRDGGNRRARARARAADPRGGDPEEHRREREDQHEPGTMKPIPRRAHHPAPQTPRAVDRELRRGRPRQQVRGGDRPLELLLVSHPPRHAQRAQQRDVRRRAAEADAADPAPLARDLRQRGLASGRGGGIAAAYSAQSTSPVRFPLPSAQPDACASLGR